MRRGRRFPGSSATGESGAWDPGSSVEDASEADAETEFGVESDGSGRGARAADPSSAYKSALRSLAAREMSGFEVARTLRRKGHPASVASEVVERLREEGWVDDVRFARAFLRHRARSKPAAVHYLRAELQKRGCDGATVSAAMDEVAEELELNDFALAVVAAESRRGAESRDFDRMLRFLARRGFSLDVARRAATEVGTPTGSVDDPS